MKRLAAIGMLIAILVGLALAGSGLAAGPLTIDWNVLVGGGGHEVEGSLTLDSIIGTWYSGNAGAAIYLPIIRK